MQGMPGEIISMDGSLDNKTEVANSTPILDVSDVKNLCLYTRRSKQTAFDVYAQRYFTVRKYVLSRASLEALLSIAQDPEWSPYVRELSIGPKDVPWFGQLNFDDSWDACQLKYWDEVVQENGRFRGYRSSCANAANSLFVLH